MKINVVLNIIAKEPVMALVAGGFILIFVSVIAPPLRISILPGVG